MTHIVIHDDANDVTHYAEFDDLQAAAVYLEELVTDDGESNARLFALEPVEFAVKSYVRVEIGGAAAPPADAASDTASDENPVEMVVAAAPAPVEVFTDSADEESDATDDTVEYVEAAMAPPETYAPAPMPEPIDNGVSGSEVRRGLFGR